MPKVIISGGGTGGHIYPAIAIANALREIDPATEILFVGAEGKMEMEKVPKSGYQIIGLPIRLSYSLIDINLDNGLGGIVQGKKTDNKSNNERSGK